MFIDLKNSEEVSTQENNEENKENNENNFEDNSNKIVNPDTIEIGEVQEVDNENREN